MAMTVHATLTANGGDIIGDSSIESLDRDKTIECLSFKDAVKTAREASSGMASGDRTYEPIVITKRIDQSSPVLARALCNNEVIEGTFKFFRPNPAGDGTTQQFFTIELQECRVSSITRISPDVIDPADATDPPTEEVSFVFGYIRWCYEPDGVEHIDHWSQRT